MSVTATIKILCGIAIAVAIISVNWWVPNTGLLSVLPDSALLRQWFTGLGGWGPAAVIGSMTLAILVSPIPSAPIALAAGAIYGHLWGTLYVVIGSQAGAIAAFSIARFLGYEVIHRRFGNKFELGYAGSQNVLMATIFISRLLPFISFDIVSYAAGLTPLTFGRFAIATLAGIIPASFLLAHFGSEMVRDESDRILLAVIFLGAFMALPFVIKLLASSNRK